MKQKSGGLSLERFAKAKQSSYDKKAKKAKELALNAKKVNKYRKLKQKLAAKGLLAPRYTYERQEGQVEMHHAQPRRARAEELAMERIHARAGPAPDSVGESGEDEMLGPQSDSDSGNEAAGQGAKLPMHPSAQSWQHANQRKRQRLVPQEPSVQHQSSDLINASLEAANIREAAAGAGSQQPEASAAGPRHAYQGIAGNGGADSKSERESEQEQEHEEGHRTEAALGRKQKRGKKRKPASQLQRVQAEVQAKKEAEQREREERRRRIKDHASRVAEAEQRRKQRTKLLRKRTQQGQPVMRYRMDKILDQLQAEAAQT